MDRAALQTLIGLPYEEQTLDCGHLVALALERLFGRRVNVPTRHPRGRLGQAALIGRLAHTLTVAVADPVSGDVALYEQTDPSSGGAHYHLGLILVMAGERWLLHVRVGGRSVLQREADATLRGLRLAGYYRLLDGEGGHGDAC